MAACHHLRLAISPGEEESVAGQATGWHGKAMLPIGRGRMTSNIATDTRRRTAIDEAAIVQRDQQIIARLSI